MSIQDNQNNEADYNLNENDMIELLKNDFEAHLTKCNYYNFPIIGYNFNGLELRLELGKYSSGNIFMGISTFSYNHENNDGDISSIGHIIFKDLNINYNKNIKNIEDVFRYLFNDFRNEFIYSKILDKIIFKSSKNVKEKRYITYNKLCKSKINIEDCCVCYELNTIKTHCKHSLCRLCYNNIIETDDEDEDGDIYSMKKCPICRSNI